MTIRVRDLESKLQRQTILLAEREEERVQAEKQLTIDKAQIQAKVADLQVELALQNGEAEQIKNEKDQMDSKIKKLEAMIQAHENEE